MLPLFVVALIGATSCNFSKGVKKDLATGLTATYNGFGVQDIYMADASGNKVSSNQIILGSPVAVIANGVTHYTEKDGKVYPGCNIILTDKNKKELLNLPDAFTDMANGTPASQAALLSAKVSTGSPMVAGETYHLYVRFYDKNNKENEILAQVDLLAK
ncbi:hypothetical protein [Taibaiella koreensis]|uniref:hypothetical protein n=1 Tax=Taibaiella koreensis TaxID=1268548 RepID=UPI000E59F51F|nr:hypothetical protein [Taibaiella koreensis]